MNAQLSEQIHRINYLTSELDALYHQAAVRIGMADSAMRILYAIHDNGESCPLSGIYKQSGISRQTVNSALRKLETEGIVYLEQRGGRSKTVRLTEKGGRYVSETVVRLCQAEFRALETWEKGEVDAYIRLTEKYLDTFREQVEGL